MDVRTPADLGTAVRAARLRMGLTQTELADAAKVSREWVSRLEHGADRLEIGLVLRTMSNLGLSVNESRVEPTPVDVEKADDIAWTMAMEAQNLTDEAYDELLQGIATRRLAREQ